MTKAAVTIKRSEGEQGYVVRVPGADHMNRVFLWGAFDDGDISWQTARVQALRYAEAFKRPVRKALSEAKP